MWRCRFILVKCMCETHSEYLYNVLRSLHTNTSSVCARYFRSAMHVFFSIFALICIHTGRDHFSNGFEISCLFTSFSRARYDSLYFLHFANATKRSYMCWESDWARVRAHWNQQHQGIGWIDRMWMVRGHDNGVSLTEPVTQGDSNNERTEEKHKENRLY